MEAGSFAQGHSGHLLPALGRMKTPRAEQTYILAFAFLCRRLHPKWPLAGNQCGADSKVFWMIFLSEDPSVRGRLGALAPWQRDRRPIRMALSLASSCFIVQYDSNSSSRMCRPWAKALDHRLGYVLMGGQDLLLAEKSEISKRFWARASPQKSLHAQSHLYSASQRTTRAEGRSNCKSDSGEISCTYAPVISSFSAPM